MAQRALAYGAASFGMLTTLTAMAALHPHQQVYFNALTDTKTPGALANRYDLDYWQLAHRQLLEHLLARYPGDTLRVWPSEIQSLILPQSDRERIVGAYDRDVDFYLNSPRHFYQSDMAEPPLLHDLKAYGSDIALILAPNSDAYRARYRAEYSDVTANGTLLARSDFDIYAHNGALRYIKENCAPLLAVADPGIFLHIIPNDPSDLPADSRERGFENRDFWIFWPPTAFPHTAFIDGKCITHQPLPDYPIARIKTGSKATSLSRAAWRVDIDLAARAAAQSVHDGILAGDYGKPVAQSDFDVYLRDNRLAYLKKPCEQDDTDARFFLHITPADPLDLPVDRRERGFVNMDFRFDERGAYAGDICVAERELPDYPIARIAIGQKTTSGVAEWRADIDLAARAAAQAVHDRIAAGDYGPPVAQSRFDIYLRDNALTYLKAPCAEGDTDARFFLHIFPADPVELTADRRERGFANLDFKFADHGIRASDMCVATIDLPDYPLDRISAGQFVSGEGNLWRTEFPVAR